eukprot:CAMPEP_0168623666 /NCGR_PEP_ID=MMETSP0449_2-20121227/8952_2 /TAXON_ID=1082188 /ORGANISM="Strombidium rassoulzadegani, Strain ras09" /LENGTH=50 /DNA_ID=CAMNT_0008665073 /DNA_START=85 /DNA_END=237 /DNA_ORIENTATION=-
MFWLVSWWMKDFMSLTWLRALIMAVGLLRELPESVISGLLGGRGGMVCPS